MTDRPADDAAPELHLRNAETGEPIAVEVALRMFVCTCGVSNLTGDQTLYNLHEEYHRCMRRIEQRMAEVQPVPV